MNSPGEPCELLGTVVKFMPGLGGMMGCEQWHKEQGEGDHFSMLWQLQSVKEGVQWGAWEHKTKS